MDHIIQKLLSNHLTPTTLITISHSHSTLLKCDKIMVLHEGRIADFDTPGKLQEKGGLFGELVRE